MLENRFTFYLITMVFLLPLIVTSQEIHKSNFNYSYPENELSDFVVRLVTSCLPNTNKLVILMGKMSESLVLKIHDTAITAVTKISTKVPFLDTVFTLAKQSWITYREESYFGLLDAAQGFIIASKSLENLQDQFEELLNSRWWNAAGFFIIINDDTNSCEYAKEFLWIAWSNNSLSSIFICRNETQALETYSYNPFNNVAPKNWIKVRQYPGRRDHPWILFRLKSFYEGAENCYEMFYDKTQTLNNYTIRTNARTLPPRLVVDYDKFGIDKYGGEEGKLIKCVFSFLNASLEDFLYPDDQLDFGYLEPNGNYSGMLADLSFGRVDIGLNGRYMIVIWKLGICYPHSSVDYCFILKSRGIKPRWMNLAYVFDVWVTLGLIIVIFLTTGILIYYTDVSMACLNSVRLVVSASLLKIPLQLPAKLFMAHVILLILIANGAFQAKFVSILTKPRAFENPEKINALRDTGYKVVGFPAFMELIEDPVLRSRYNSHGRLSCVNRTLHSEHIICLIDCQIFYNDPNSRSSDIHVIHERLMSFHIHFLTSSDWPLLKRFDQITQRLVAAGIPNHWRKSEREEVIGYFETENVEENRPPILSLSDLAFIFYWILLGHISGTLVFICEVLSVRYGIKFHRIRIANSFK